MAKLNNIRRWTFTVESTSPEGKSVATIAIPGFSLGIRAAADEAAAAIQLQYETEEAKARPLKSERCTYKVQIAGHEGINPELFENMMKLQKQADEGKKGSEIYRGLVMVACQELSDRHPIELGKPNIIFANLLKKFQALSKGKDPNAKIELITTSQAAGMGLQYEL